MKMTLFIRRLCFLLLITGLVVSESVTGGSSARADGLRHLYPSMFGPIVPPYAYGNYGYGRGGHHGHRHGHGYGRGGFYGSYRGRGLGIRTPPGVNRFVIRAPIAIAPYTYYYGNNFLPYSGYYGNSYYGSGYSGYLGNPYYTNDSYYRGNNWGINNFYGNNFNVPQSTTYPTPAAIALENLRMKKEVEENRKEWIQKIPGMPDRVIIAVRPSAPEDNLKSVRAQALGDGAMRRGEFGRAYEYYERSVKQSSDKAEFRISLATVLAATGRFDTALKQIETAAKLEPNMEKLPRTLDQIFREEGANEREILISNLYGWTEEDQDDPNRLMLMGTFLALDGKPQDARAFLEVATATAEEDDVALAFLTPIRGEAEVLDEEAANAEPIPYPDLPPPGYGVLAVSPEEASYYKPDTPGDELPQPPPPSAGPNPVSNGIDTGPQFPD
ncbi:Tetratricopeptide repeat protein [Polystyrenella longa]|uniref:Tetratricopeptide repeat protein n=1 Tax=Polystyrenella longa TaxID=2528007 RepID=A0A518CR36_9PLAN|nr:tetratricopeptide repeat protein [Polystyrenella longa]QDU81687.1 Tetratricopeptide repeat protein [Polystyrenella longa]